MKQIKAVIFDMDGVLIDAKDWHFEALNKALSLFGFAISYDEHLSVYDGLPTRKKLEILSKSRNLPWQLHDFLNEMKQRETEKLTVQHCAPVFHHQYALSMLKRDGYRVAVCSNSIKGTIQLMMERSSLLPYLDFYLSNEDVSNSKPDPEIYSLAFQRLGLRPDECLILEDNDHGIRAARASGAFVMEIGTVNDVNYQQIQQKIDRIEAQI